MSKSSINPNSNPVKLTSAQRHILQLLDDGVGIRKRYGSWGARWYYRENQDDYLNQYANKGTISSLFSKGCITKEEYRHDGRRFDKLVLTDLGRAALAAADAGPDAPAPKDIDVGAELDSRASREGGFIPASTVTPIARDYLVEHPDHWAWARPEGAWEYGWLRIGPDYAPKTEGGAK